jgi:hypothetical protein
VIERILTTPMYKDIPNTTKSLLGRLNSIYDYSVNFKTKSHESVPIKTCDDLLNYYQKISPELVAEARKTGYVTVHEAGYMPQYVSIEGNVQELAKALATASNHDITDNLNLSNDNGWSR